MMYSELTDNSRLKILLITSAFPPPCDGGSLVYLYETVKHLPPDEIIVSTSRRNQPGWEEFDKGQKFKVIRSWLAPHYRRNPFKALGIIHHTSFVIWFFHLFYQILSYRVNMIQAGHPSFFHYLEGIMVRVLSRLLRKPYILYTYGEEITQVLVGSRIERTLMFWVLHGASKVITISDFSAKRLMEAGVKSENIEKICPGVDTNLFHPSVEIENVIKKHNLEGRKVVLTLGRLVERKGYDYVIKSLPTVLEKVPNLVYIIAGRGLYESRLRELVKELHLEDYVIFAGYVDESPAYYNACDVFIMANRKLDTDDTEGFGMVFTEANACGKPVIGGKAGGTSDAVLDGYTGILVDGTDCAQISSALLDILTDKERANQLGSNGRKRVKAEFSWKKNAERVRDISLEVLRNDRRKL